MTDAPPLPRRVRLERRDDAKRTPQRSRARRLLSFFLTALVVAGAVYLWPARFGGSTRLVIVSGHSMEPTYDLGDIVIAREGHQPGVGDIVVFAVPDGNAKGMLVIHRIVDVDEQGRYTTQGDNRDTPDQWQLTQADIVGTPLVRVPKGGVAIRLLQRWYVLAAIIGLLAIALLWPRSSDAGSEDESDDTEPDDDAAGVAPEALPRLDLPPTWRVGEWSDGDLPAAAMADAEKWLERELERELTPAGR